MPLATSTFLQVVFAMLLVVPVIVLWVVAVHDMLRREHSGLKIAAMLVLILIVPILGPLLYFVFRGPGDAPAPEDAEAAYLARAELQREAARRPVGGTGM
jgi:hypothetical protein